VRPVVVIVAALAGAGLLVGAGLVVTNASHRACSGPTTKITAVASPGEFQALDTVARQWTATGSSVDGRCAGASVVLKDSSQAAAALGPSWDPARDGPRPDVWVPDSSLWLNVAATRPDGRSLLPESTTSTASSPIVLAVRQPVMQALGWPNRALGWDEVLGAFFTPDTFPKIGHPEWASLRMGMTDPTVSTAGLASALALLDRDANGELSDAEISASVVFSSSLGAMAPDTTTFFNEQHNSSADATSVSVAAFPAIERDVASYDASSPSVQLVPVYTKQNPVNADFPYAILKASWVDGHRRAVAEAFLRYVLSPAGQRTLAADGFRDPTGNSARTAHLTGDLGFQGAIGTPRKNPNTTAVSAIITAWTGLERGVNILAVVDTSGSMKQPVPGTSLSRLQLLQQTAITGFNLMTAQTKIGLWQFSTNLTPTTDYRELVPYGPLNETINGVPRVKALVGAVSSLQAGGDTALYDTAYAAWKAAQARWLPNATNAVLLITDGKNDNPKGGMTLEQVVQRLTQEAQPDKPTNIIGIAVGPEADANALQQLSQATGGRTFVARDAATAVQTLVLAFAGRVH
jgi:Ca-activated chloride channel family protein